MQTAAVMSSPNCQFTMVLERAFLLKALSYAQGIVERRNTIPILNNVLLQCDGSVISLTATDMDMNLQVKLPAAAGSSAGETTLPLHMLYDIVRKLPDGAQIYVHCDDKNAQIVCDKSDFTLSCLPVADFPKIDKGEYTATAMIRSDYLRALLDKTKFSMSSETTRYFLNGIFTHATTSATGDAILRCVATDGHRLAQAEIPLPSGAAKMPAVIIPRKAVLEMGKLLDDAPEEISVSFSETKLRLEAGEAQLTTKLVDGKYPDYTKVIPQHNEITLLADVKKLAEAVDRVATVATDKNRAIKIQLDADLLTIFATSAESGKGHEEVEAKYSNTEMAIGFNARYLLDVLGQIETARVEFRIADSSSPIVIVGEGDPSSLYVLMPMRV